MFWKSVIIFCGFFSGYLMFHHDDVPSGLLEDELKNLQEDTFNLIKEYEEMVKHQDAELSNYQSSEERSSTSLEDFKEYSKKQSKANEAVNVAPKVTDGVFGGSFIMVPDGKDPMIMDVFRQNDEDLTGNNHTHGHVRRDNNEEEEEEEEMSEEERQQKLEEFNKLKDDSGKIENDTFHLRNDLSDKDST